MITLVAFIVGSRASNLAKAQVREYLAPLRERFPEVTFTHRVILEGGDRDRRSLVSNVSAVSGVAPSAPSRNRRWFGETLTPWSTL
jgi:hypothetical protein